MILLVVLFLTQFSVANSSATCPTINIAEKYRDCPIGENPNGGYCYAYTAASMLTAYYGTCVSPLSLVAANFNSRKNLNIEEMKGGHTLSALYSGLRYGFCSPSEIFEIVGPTTNIDEALSNIENFHERHSHLNNQCPIYSLPRKTLADLSEISNISVEYIVSQITNAHCASQRKSTLSYEQMPRSHIFSRSIDISTIIESLSLGNAIGVNYDTAFMLDKKIDKAPHAATIIGIRNNNNKCEVLLRNSWGANCEVGSYKLNSKYLCEQGNIWVPWEDLVRSSFDFDVIYSAKDYLKTFGKEHPKFNFNPPRL